MRHALIITLFLFGTALFAQSNNGIRIGNGNSGFYPKVSVNTSNQLELEKSTDSEAISAFEIYDSNYNIVGSSEFEGVNRTTVNLNGLEAGMYYIAIISETDKVQVSTFVKQ